MEQKATILYVEDDEVLSFVTQDNLEMHGYAVVHAGDGESALRLFSEIKADLCILDVMLPAMDGYTLYRRTVYPRIQKPKTQARLWH